MSNNKAANAALKQAVEKGGEASNKVVIITFVVNILLSASLSQLWGMINSIQIIAHMVFFNVYIPANVS